MEKNSSYQVTRYIARRQHEKRVGVSLGLKIIAFIGLIFLIVNLQGFFDKKRSPFTYADYPSGIRGTQPLAMEGGDPYIRALMRTITKNAWTCRWLCLASTLKNATNAASLSP
jgi:hypothetical protein